MTAPTNTTFISGTKITSEWLNGVNDHVNNLEIDPHPSYLSKTEAANTYITQTDLASSAAGKGAELVAYMPAGTGAVATDVQAKLREVVSITDFGAKGDSGTTNNRDAITAAIAAAVGRTIFVPVDTDGGNYAITSGTLVIPAGQRFVYEGDARIYSAGGAISDAGRHFSVLGAGNSRASTTTTRGLNVQLMGGNTGDVTDVSAQYNNIKIRGDKLNGEAGAGTKVNGLIVDHSFGGAGTKGGRHGIEINLTQDGVTDSDSTDRNYVAMSAHVTSGTGDGGDSATTKGSYFGVEALVYLAPGSTYARNVTAVLAEPYIAAGASATAREGVKITSLGPTRGIDYDNAITVGGQISSAKFKNGIHFSAVNGAVPLSSDSIALKIDSGPTIDAVIDVTGVTTTDLIRSSTTFFKDSSLTMERSGASITLGAKGSSNTPTISFHSGATYASGGDASITATGGNGTASNGNLTFNCAASAFRGTVRPTTDNAVSLGANTFRWSNVYATNIKTTPVTVATLPAAGTAGAGTRAFVSDATATTFASIVAGGGSNNVPVYSDGTNWLIG